MARISPGKCALAFAIVFAVFHLAWTILVAAGWAQPVIDFVLWMHFIKPIYMIEPFEIIRAVALLIVTAATGLILGALFAGVWNALRARA